ncbi:MAG: metal-dependent hydrolase [Desulfovibrio sp.]|nr:metal-dependent hydrolase [Desulfovibrio sp.]
MKWITHQIGAVSLGLAWHLPLPGLAAICAGAVLPDMLDMRIAGLAATRAGRQRLFNAVHRGGTHWMGWWLALWIGALSVSGLPDMLRELALGLGLGGLSHVFLDMLTPAGVPLLPHARRPAVSLKICATGSLGEYCILALIVGAAWFFLRDDILSLARRLHRITLF